MYPVSKLCQLCYNELHKSQFNRLRKSVKQTEKRDDDVALYTRLVVHGGKSIKREEKEKQRKPSTI